MFVFSHIFPLIWEFTFPIFWKLYGLMPHMKYVRNPQLCNVCVFPYISLTMSIHFSHVLRIVQVSVSREIFKKPITHNFGIFVLIYLEMFCFLIFFLYYRKSLSPCFGDNTTDVKTNKKFLFSIPFPLKCLCETLH